MPTTTPMTSQTIRLYGWDPDWRTAAHTVLAKLFGELLQRAVPVVQHYHSDLFHDAEWLRANVNGPTHFHWMARLNGTHIADAAPTWEQITVTEPRELYHVALNQNGGLWTVTFTLLVQHTED